MKKKPQKTNFEKQYSNWDHSMKTFAESLFDELTVDEETSFRYRKTLLDRYSRENEE